MTVGVSAALATDFLTTLLAGDNHARLHTGDPGAAGTLHVSLGHAGLAALEFGSITAGSADIDPAHQPTWTNDGAVTETLSHVSFWDGNDPATATFLFSMLLPATQVWSSTNTYTLDTLTVAFAPVAA